MTQREDVAALCRQGMSPLQIAEHMGLDFYRVKTHLLTQVGEGDLRRSDVYFSIPNDNRKEYAEFFDETPHTDYWDIINAAIAAGFENNEFRLYVDLRNSRAWRADLYEYIADFELAFHDFVRQTLKEVFGEAESEWWHQGVPKTVRQQCVQTREQDDEWTDDPFVFTNFIHLSLIVEKNWKAFEPRLPEQISTNRKQFISDLNRLNGIRNVVMHPVKRVEPTDNDALFVRDMYRILEPVMD